MLKRGFDIIAALSLMLVLAPVYVIVALLVWRDLGRPVLFGHERAGRNGRPFRMIKFRTMSDVRDNGGKLLPDAERVTPFGLKLRSTSLDELPELWNVLRGDMSLVGPRPLPMRYIPRYSPEQAKRLEVRPGVTGWAQVKGRNATDWPTRLGLDVWYVAHRSFALDLKILFLTIATVLRRDGIQSSEGDFMAEFRGDEDRM